MMADHGSYNVTTYIKKRKEKKLYYEIITEKTVIN